MNAALDDKFELNSDFRSSVNVSHLQDGKNEWTFNGQRSSSRNYAMVFVGLCCWYYEDVCMIRDLCSLI